MPFAAGSPIRVHFTEIVAVQRRSVSLHREGLAGNIINLGEWREHLLSRLQRQIAVSLDADLAALYDEVSAYPCPDTRSSANGGEHADILVPLRLRDGDGELEFFSTMTVFGTALDITVAELAIESFFPANARTASLVQARVDAERAWRSAAESA